jgi:hypothetical protein
MAIEHHAVGAMQRRAAGEHRLAGHSGGGRCRRRSDRRHSTRIVKSSRFTTMYLPSGSQRSCDVGAFTVRELLFQCGQGQLNGRPTDAFWGLVGVQGPFVADQRPPVPVHGDVAEQPMLDLG